MPIPFTAPLPLYPKPNPTDPNHADPNPNRNPDVQILTSAIKTYITISSA